MKFSQLYDKNSRKKGFKQPLATIQTQAMIFNSGGGNEPAPENPYTWEGVAYYLNNGTYKDVYKIGDEVPLDLGSEGVINMQVVAIDDFMEIADGKYAPITFVARDLLATDVKMGVANDWLKSGAYTHLQNVVKPLLPEIVSNRLKTSAVAGSDLWIPSEVEVDAGSSSVPTQWFPILRQMSGTERSAWRTKKKYGATSSSFWLTRTTISYGSTKYYRTVDGGGSGYGALTSAYAVCFGFCLGKSK